MAKRTALAKVEPIEAFLVLDEKNNFKSMTPAFIKQVSGLAGEIGGLQATLIKTADQKAQIVLNLVNAFDAWSKVTVKSSLTKFVKTYFDSKIPESYGKPGSDERKKVNASPVFRGIEYMVKQGRKAIAGQKQQLAITEGLSENGIDPKDAAKVADYISKHNARAKQEKAAGFQRSFNLVMAEFERKGVTQETITMLVVKVLGKKEKKTDTPTTAGTKIITEAFQEVLRIRGLKVQASAQVTTDLAEKLTAAAGNNAEVGKLAKGKK